MDILIGIVIAIVFLGFCCSRYAPETLWGWVVFLSLTCIMTPVVTFPAQWIYAKYVR